MIKGAGLPIGTYLTLLEESTHWQELLGKKCIRFPTKGKGNGFKAKEYSWIELFSALI